MTIPKSFTFLAANAVYLNWTLTDPLTGNPINDATVTANLYSGRNRNDPDTTPGTVVPNFSSLNLVFVANGLYRGIISAAFDPEPGGNYVLVVDASSPSYLPQHWESPAIVRPRGS